MPVVHVWNARDCILELAWRSAAAARRLKPLLLATTFACGGSASPPPTEAHGPPPAHYVVPPVSTWTPGVPIQPWQFLPMPTWTPPATPIPLGPVLTPPSVREETFEAPRFEAALPPLCDTNVAPKSPVPEPQPLGLFVLGGTILFIWRALKWA